MLRKRSILLFLVLIVLLGLTLVLSNIEEQTSRVYEDEAVFAIEDVSQIDKLIITSKSFKNVLVKVNDIWRIQDRYEVDPEMMSVLMNTLQNVRVRKSVPGRLSSEISEDLGENGVLVEVFEGDEKISNFYAGGDLEKKETYFLSKETKEPLIVYVPGYDQFISGIFELKDTEWRNRVIFSSNSKSLKRLKVAYPQEPSDSFEVTNQDSAFAFSPVNNIDTVNSSQEYLDTVKLMSYLELFNYVEAENYTYRDKFPLFDSLLLSKPLLIIELTDTNPRKTNSLKIFRPLDDDQTVLGIVGEDQLAVLKFPKIRNIIKRRPDFLKN